MYDSVTVELKSRMALYTSSPRGTMVLPKTRLSRQSMFVAMGMLAPWLTVLPTREAALPGLE